MQLKGHLNRRNDLRQGSKVLLVLFSEIRVGHFELSMSVVVLPSFLYGHKSQKTHG